MALPLLFNRTVYNPGVTEKIQKGEIKMGKTFIKKNIVAAPVIFLTLLFLMPFLTTVAKAAEIPEGASFELMTDIGFNGSKFYLYSPSHPNLDFDMSRMLNSVIFVYPDKPYDTKEKAWGALIETGLLDMAEKEVAYVIMPLPVAGDTWSEADLKLYYESQYYLAGGDVYNYPSMQYKRFVFNNLQYVIAEGNGSIFVNNILSQHAERIAGILTFGGTIGKSIRGGLALPAYLVNADNAAVSYFRAVNKADTEVKPGVFENSSYKLKKVITSKGGDAFDAGIIADAWKQIFSRTARACVTDNVVLNNKVTSEWVLMERPNYRELGITRVDHKKEKLPDGTVITWYDFVPDAVMKHPKIKVPLVITLHGMGDDPIYQADSNGWTAKAAEKGFIVISPDYPGANAEGEKVVLKILEYARTTYPIDESRVYLAGFSMGGATTAMVGLKNTDKFAAIAPMGATGYHNDAFTAYVNSIKDKTDMPFVIIIGTEDSPNVTMDKRGNKVVSGGGPFKGGLKLLMEINNIDSSSPDYVLYPYWGYPAYNPDVLTSRDLKYDVSYMYKEGSDKPIAKLVLFKNAGHAHSDYYATLAWDFFSMFSQSPPR
jgi:poly(3-hydroxybutyrate) depolymerase